MTKTKVTIAAGALALALAMLHPPSQAQGPLYDQVNVSLPYSVTVGERTLQPGDYVIRQLPSPGGASRVLLISSDRGMKFETSAMTIPTLDNNTPEDTKVVLHHFGPEYYFDKIWIQGKNYGYEFPLSDSLKARQKERTEPVSVAGRYEAMPAETTSSETTTTAENQAQTQAPAEPSPAPAPEPAPAQEPVTTAQAQPPAEPAPPPAPEETPAPPATTAQPAIPSETGTADRAMPETAANWLTMLFGGGLLSGAGLVLRRKR